MNNKNKKYIFTMVMCALLIALKIVLERFLSYSVWNQRIGFSFIAVAFAASMLGLPAAITVAGLGDLLGALLFPSGPYFPGFTLTAILTAICTALFIRKNATFTKILLSVIINQIFGSVLLNSVWISILYGADYSTLIITRITQAILMTVIQIVLIYFLFGKDSTVRKQLVAVCPM